MKKPWGKWLAVGNATIGGLYAAYIFAWMFVWVPTHARQTKRMVFEADHPALLNACRFMISNSHLFTNDWASNTARNQVGISEEQVLSNPHVPPIIRTIAPMYISLEQDRAVVALHGPPRMYFIGYAEGVRQDGTERLTDGLWYFNGKWQSREPNGQQEVRP